MHTGRTGSRLRTVTRPAALLLTAVLTLGVLTTATAVPSAAAPPGAQPTAVSSATTPGKPVVLQGILRVLAADTVEGQHPHQQFTGHSHDHYTQLLVVGDDSYVLKGKKGRANTKVRVSAR